MDSDVRNPTTQVLSHGVPPLLPRGIHNLAHTHLHNLALTHLCLRPVNLSPGKVQLLLKGVQVVAVHLDLLLLGGQRLNGGQR